ncbi:hypothetical protein JN11_00834 [Mucilaginibacter frigoritolerans]|uniref:Uncharacterized protein n=1 Tax=Mucilaginibacter frigoritolerans TaxID=652788 RepID=A0A562UBX7_9SPHI|nr:hypothetical protein [Mucilaginibacter frigoritolerans]TWJ03296.1 hypothetical protein JN11_00834 [Mucilaginibacter frigoritolerans]
MAQHKLPEGNEFIEGLRVLGAVLGYATESEFPVIATDPEGIAVDVAWFLEKGQKFPLFIFEVETTASNSMVYNPLKVLSKPNEIFEKPLFYFQIVLNQGQNSSRIDDLKRAYGIYNYRVYRLSLSEELLLISDILSQHRRLSGELDIVKLVDFIKQSQWVNLSIPGLINQIRLLDFEIKSGEFLQSIGILSLKYQDIVSIYCSELEKFYAASIDYHYDTNYQTYIGMHFPVALHLGIRAANVTGKLEKGYCFEKLVTWQNNGERLTMVGPHFGLSQDYDQFLIYMSGGYFALLACLFDGLDNSRIYFCDELEKIINASALEYRIFNYLWLMLIAPRKQTGKTYIDKASQFFVDQNFFSKEIAANLPFLADDELLYDFQNAHDEFSAGEFFNKSDYEVNTELLTQTAIAALVDPGTNEEIGQILKAYLLKP